PDVSTGPNLLLATTYGSGSYGIRLAPIVFNDSTNKVTESQDTTTGVLTFKGLSEQSAFGTSVTVTVEDVTDPNNPVPLGTGQTDVNGKFSVTGSYPAPPAGNPFFFDGTRKVEIFATDASGTKGNVVNFQITNSLPAPTSGPVFVNANDSAPPLTNGVVSAGTVITTSSPLPTFQFTVPNPGLGQTIAVTLIRVDSQQNTVPVASTTLNGTNSGSTLTGFLQDPGPLAVGAYTYEFQYTVTVAGQPTNSPISPGTTVQVVAPMAAPNLYFLDDSGVVGDGITNVTKPRFTGTAIPNAANDPALMLELVETAYTSNLTGVPVPLPTPVVLSAPVVDPVNGQYLLQPTTALADGVYTLVVVATDAAGDVITSAATKPPTLTISTQGPKIVPTIALLPASDVPSNNPNATVVRRPYVHGSTDPGAVVTIYGSVDGGPKIPLATTTANLTTGAYQVQLPSFLNDGTVTLYASAANAAGNTNPKQGTFTLQIISVPGDYTGVGAAGAAIYSPSTGNYTFEHAVTGGLTVVYGFGLPNVDIPVPGDYNGDGQTDPAIYRPTNGWWAVDVNSQAAGQYVLYVPPIIPPAPGIIPVPADYDTNGQTDPAVYSIVPYNGINYGVYTILHNLVSGANTSSLQSIAWGIAGDMPVPGNYDGAGAAQVAVYRPSTGAWYIRSSGVGGGAATPAGTREPTVFVTAWKAGDVPDAANYDGIVNGTTKAGQLEEAIYRPSTETFYIYNPTTKTTRQVTMPKLAGQGPNDVIIPASADFTGDGRADAAIYDQTLGTFEYINSATGAVVTHHFTLTSGDIPLTAPEPYRAAANAAGAGGAQAAFLKAGAFLAAAPASSSGSATPAAAGTGTGSTAAAVVVGATVPTGLTSTGKTSTLPPAPVPTPAPITLITSGNSVNRPAQGDATDSAIASLGQSYKGTFI
ncbi:MAG TPA: Ig-like domain-containing protein, partial [Isosphaeraceae bacterium]|nr:Ig-like domain-containing protein [Isosphaeraceae bacterium]